MVQLKALISLLVFLFFATPIRVDAQSTQQNVSKQVVVLKKKTSTARPRTPDFQEVVCEWEDDVLSISFDIPEGNASVTVTNSSGMPVLIDTFDTSFIYSDVVGDLSTLCGIEVVTDDGNSYIGWF